MDNEKIAGELVKLAASMVGNDIESEISGVMDRISKKHNLLLQSKGEKAGRLYVEIISHLESALRSARRLSNTKVPDLLGGDELEIL